MPEHFAKLRAQTIPTIHFRLAKRAVDDIVAVNGMALIHGEAGLGKSYAAQAAVSQHEGRSRCELRLPLRSTPKEIATELLRLLKGLVYTEERRKLDLMLFDLLAAHEHLVVVDEAQNLNHLAVEYLRHLHDDPNTRFALLLVGGNGCWSTIARYPMLRSRIYRRVRFEALATDDVLHHMPQFHPIYQDVDAQLLRWIDDHFAHGNLRAWASFTRSAVDLLKAKELEALDKRVAQNVFALNGGVNREQ